MKEYKENEKQIFLKADINEIFATTELTQFFKNPYDDSIELYVKFPIKPFINLSKFEITMKNKIVISKILEKEKSKEKYSDAIAEGNIGITSEYSKSLKSYIVNIGNIAPKESLCLKTIYNQLISSYDMSYEYIIMKDFPSFFNKNLKRNIPEIIYDIKISTFSQITRLFTNFNQKKNLNIIYNKNYTEAKISNSTIENFNNIKNNKIKKSNSNSDELHILFRTKDIYKPCLYYQYNPILKKHSYALNYMYCTENVLKSIKTSEKPVEDEIISFYDKYQKNLIYEEPSLFLFLIDQSASMDGKPIELVKESLLIFIQSLPKNSYFQIIGFGSNYKMYNKTPVKYNNSNIKEIMIKIKAFRGDMGGTHMFEPLKNIFNNLSQYEKIKLNKHLFLLTDGEVFDDYETIDIIKKNLNKFRIHAIGYGEYFNKNFIINCGKQGRGSSSHFVKNINNINLEIIKILNECIKPYLYDIKITFLNIDDCKGDKNDIIFVKNDNFVYQDEIINYSFILDENSKHSLVDLQNNIYKFNIEFYKDSKLEKKILKFEKDIIKLSEGENMIKIIIDKYLKNEPNISNEKEIKLSKEYEVLSENTSLFAKILNDNSTQSKLVKVNINSDLDKSYESDDVSSDIRYKKKRAIKKRAIKKSSTKKCAKKKCAKKKSKIFLNKKRDRSSDSGEISSNEEEMSLDSEEISSDSLDKKKKKRFHLKKVTII